MEMFLEKYKKRKELKYPPSYKHLYNKVQKIIFNKNLVKGVGSFVPKLKINWD